MSKKQSKVSYRSKFEVEVAKKLPNCDYEPFSVKYTVPKLYTPDFVSRKKPNILLEVKGYFRTYAEASKYIHVRDANPGYEIVFLFADPRKPMPGARKRKDGTKFTMGDWATVNGFRYVTLDTLKGLKL